MSLDWMYWTFPTAVFFLALVLIITAMTIWQTLAPSRERRGFLPMATTPGDRLFIGIISALYLHLGWLGFTPYSLWIIFPVALIWIAVVMIWG